MRVIYIDVRENPEHLADMLQLSNGTRLVPVIVSGETIAIGFGGRS